MTLFFFPLFSSLEGTSIEIVFLVCLIEGHLVVEVLLIVVILFQLSRKSYKPPKKPLTEKVGWLFSLHTDLQQLIHYLPINFPIISEF